MSVPSAVMAAVNQLLALPNPKAPAYSSLLPRPPAAPGVGPSRAGAASLKEPESSLVAAAEAYSQGLNEVRTCRPIVQNRVIGVMAKAADEASRAEAMSRQARFTGNPLWLCGHAGGAAR